MHCVLSITEPQLFPAVRCSERRRRCSRYNNRPRGPRRTSAYMGERAARAKRRQFTVQIRECRWSAVMHNNDCHDLKYK